MNTVCTYNLFELLSSPRFPGKVSSDQTKDDEIISVEISDISGGTGQD